MHSRINIGYILSLISLIYLFSCAESPKTSSKKRNPTTGITERIETKVEKLAVKYEGVDTLSRKCDLYLSLDQAKDAESNQHHHELLVKVDYSTMDGHKPADERSKFYLYDSNSDTYHDTHSNQQNAQLTLLGFTLKDDKQDADRNQINIYRTNKQLRQSIRINFSNSVDEHDLEKALKGIIENNDGLDQYRETLNNVESIFLTLAHNDHYHDPSCQELSPVGIVKKTFNLSLEDDEHDHDEEHEDEHNHQDELISDGKIKTMALKFKGKFRDRINCNLSIAPKYHPIRHNGKEYEAMIKVDLTTPDGHKPNDELANFYLYDGRANKFYDLDSNQSNTRLSILGASLKVAGQKIDKNKINDYMGDKTLKQMIRVQFAKNIVYDDFEKALDEVIEKKKTIKQNFNQLNVIKAIALILSHGDHYHTPLCLNLSPDKIEETTFNLSGEHDHEHDHNDEHEHGHRQH